MVPRSRVKGSIIYKVEERGHSKNIIFYPGTETSFINCKCKNILSLSKGLGGGGGNPTPILPPGIKNVEYIMFT